MPLELRWKYVYGGGHVSYEQEPLHSPTPMSDKEIDDMIKGLITLANFPYLLIKKVLRFCC